MPFQAVLSRHLSVAVGFNLMLTGLAACATGSDASWQSPTVALPAELSDTQTASAKGAAERNYAIAFQLESEENAACVEYYFRATAWAWYAIDPALLTATPPPARAWSLYHSALTKLLVTAQQYGRWNPHLGITIAGPSGLAPLPISYHGFPWKPADFHDLHPVGEYQSPYLSRSYRGPGLGVPLVVVHRSSPQRPFTQEIQPFPATVILRACHPRGSHPALRIDHFTTVPPPIQNGNFRLEFYDPHRQRTLPLANTSVAVAYNLTASLAYSSLEEDRAWLSNFLQPGATGKGDGLLMIEPYQPGKIPIVFIHGLLSDPRTWGDLANELRGHQEITDRYQLMAYRYATGEPFFESAAVLRQQLHELRKTYNPHGVDPAFSQMILIGHSMGGLVAKLQSTYSGDQLWQAAARCPLAQVKTSPLLRAKLTEAFFFDPNPDIQRVIFIGTPHQGSSWARRSLGRIGSMLVKQSEAIQQQHTQLIQNNPNVFHQEIERRFPTSIDLLEPSSPLLNATLTLPFRRNVTIHTIAGDFHTNLRDGPTDTVVPLSSARLRGVNSEKIVAAKHTHLNRHPDTVKEIIRILHQHLRMANHRPRLRDQPQNPTNLVTSPESIFAR
ncbi:MAG: alpha/beta hydrolase [Pirellulales bacterium]